MKEQILLHNRKKPAHAEGRVRIELTDPRTGKIKERITGHNAIFEDAFFMQNWILALKAMPLALTNFTGEVDPDFPFIPGKGIGYGVPSAGSSGTYQGMSTANQVLALNTTASLFFRFQYDFTASQANGTIGTVGLTQQWLASYSNALITDRKPFDGFTKLPGGVFPNPSTGDYACDGVNVYTCTAAGVVSVHNVQFSTLVRSVDLSAVLGTGTNTYRFVAINDVTGECYIITTSATSSLRKLYKFSDNTFSTYLGVVSIPNFTQHEWYGFPAYAYGNYIYVLVYGNLIQRIDITTGAVTSFTITLSFVMPHSVGLDGTTYVYKNYIVCFGGGTSNTSSAGVIFDMATEQWQSQGSVYSSNGSKIAYHPHYTRKVPFFIDYMHTKCAVAQYKLPSPITKTSANGMTVTYEVEVFW